MFPVYLYNIEIKIINISHTQEISLENTLFLFDIVQVILSITKFIYIYENIYCKC